MELLTNVYEDITENEIKTGTEFDDLAEAELIEWLRRGTIFQKYIPFAPPSFHSSSLLLPPSRPFLTA